MKQRILIFAMALWVVSAPQADEAVRLRYDGASARMSLSMNQDIGVPDHPSIASRDFSFDLTLAADRTGAALTVTIDNAEADYVAHGQKQRLGTRNLTGKSFPLSIGKAGRQLEHNESPDTPLLDLGSMIPAGFSVAALLADTLPQLPEQAIVVGASWTTEQAIRSLEGWGWGTGPLTSRHRVTAVDRRGDHTVVSVTSEAEASLIPVEGDRGYTGELKRSLTWSFDATDRRLLSLSMKQESDGVCPLPQGETRILQKTTVELAPRS